MKQDLFLKILVWREKHIKEKDFILILSFFIGLLGAVAALMLKEAIHLIQKILTNHFSIDGANYLYLLYPIIGIGLSWLYVHYIVKDDISRCYKSFICYITAQKPIEAP